MFSALFFLLIVAGVFPLSIYLVNTLHRPGRTYSQILDADDLFFPEQLQTQDWWEQRRALFNQILAINGMAAFLLYHLLVRSDSVGRLLRDSNLYFLFLQILAYLLYMGVANLFFNLGPILEMNYHPNYPETFRRKTLYAIIAVAMLIPVIVALLFYLTG